MNTFVKYKLAKCTNVRFHFFFPRAFFIELRLFVDTDTDLLFLVSHVDRHVNILARRKDGASTYFRTLLFFCYNNYIVFDFYCVAVA